MVRIIRAEAPSITSCSPTVFSGSVKSPRTSSGSPTHNAIRRSPPWRRTSIGAVTTVDVLPVTRFPTTPVRGPAQRVNRYYVPVVGGGPARAYQYHTVGAQFAATGRRDAAVRLVQADGPAQRRRVFFPLAAAHTSRAVGITGDGGSGGPLYLDDRRRHCSSASMMKTRRSTSVYPSTPVPAPWPMLARLPRGPELGAGRVSRA